MMLTSLFICAFATLVSSNVIYKDAYGNFVKYEGRNDELNVYRNYRQFEDSPRFDERSRLRKIPALSRDGKRIQYSKDYFESYPAFKTYKAEPALKEEVGTPLESVQQSPKTNKDEAKSKSYSEDEIAKLEKDAAKSEAALKFAKDHAASKKSVIIEKVQEVAKKEVAKKEVAKKEVAKKEVAKKEVAKKEVAKKEVAKKEVAKKEVAKKAYKYDNLFDDIEDSIPTKKDVMKSDKKSAKDIPPSGRDAPAAQEDIPVPTKDAPVAQKGDVPVPTAWDELLQKDSRRRNDEREARYLSYLRAKALQNKRDSHPNFERRSRMDERRSRMDERRARFDERRSRFDERQPRFDVRRSRFDERRPRFDERRQQSDERRRYEMRAM